MRKDRKKTENQEIRFNEKMDKKVLKKMQKEDAKAEKRKNSKFRNSKFGKKWFALSKGQRVTIWVLCILLVLVLAVFGTVYGMFSRVQNSVDEGNLGISTDIEDKYEKTNITNIALFGVDTRNKKSFEGRSDTIMIASVDKETGTIKLTSILRDSEVAIEGHGKQKIAHAYALGGPELAIKTLNQNFQLNISDYATVNFSTLGEAIDVVGGVDVEITERERKHMNDIGDDDDPNFPYIKKSGQVHLNGKQAVVYARIRKLDSDNKRAERQKIVLEQVIQKAKKISPAKYGEMVKVGMKLCETSLSFSEIMSFSPMLSGNIQLVTRVVPSEAEHPQSGTFDGTWLWKYDLDLATKNVHEFICGTEPESMPEKTSKPMDTDKAEPPKQKSTK